MSAQFYKTKIDTYINCINYNNGNNNGLINRKNIMICPERQCTEMCFSIESFNAHFRSKHPNSNYTISVIDNIPKVVLVPPIIRMNIVSIRMHNTGEYRAIINGVDCMYLFIFMYCIVSNWHIYIFDTCTVIFDKFGGCVAKSFAYIPDTVIIRMGTTPHPFALEAFTKVIKTYMAKNGIQILECQCCMADLVVWFSIKKTGKHKKTDKCFVADFMEFYGLK